MGYYSVAASRDKLSSLIDKALAGEEVIITRHGKPTVALQVVAARPEPTREARAESFDRLRKLRDSLPKMTRSYVELKRVEEEERGL